MKRDFGRDFTLMVLAIASVFAIITIALLLALFGSVLGKVITFLIALLTLAITVMMLYCVLNQGVYEELVDDFKNQDLNEVKKSYF